MVGSLTTSWPSTAPDPLVGYASRTMTLEPGDVLVTGTPSGVGMAADPPRFLRDGDRIRVEIDGLGELENTVRVAS